MYGGQEDIHITDLEDETIKKKITIYKRVKDVPIFSSRNLKSKKGNCLLKHQLQSVLNFINFRAHDHDNYWNIIPRHGSLIKETEKLKHSD